MENVNTKLKIGDIFAINSGEYYDLKKGKYKVVGLTKSRFGAPMYKVMHDRKNAVTEYYLYVSDLDADLYEPKVEDLTCSLGILFLNKFNNVIKYDEELIKEARRINSGK